MQPLLGQTWPGFRPRADPRSGWTPVRSTPAGLWNTSTSQRELTMGTQRALTAALSAPLVELGFESGDSVTLTPAPRGRARAGPGLLVADGPRCRPCLRPPCAVLVARPIRANQLYALMSFGHVTSLVFLAAMSTGDLTVPLGFMRWDQPARLVNDMLTVATLVQVMALYPVPQAGKQWLASMSWGADRSDRRCGAGLCPVQLVAGACDRLRARGAGPEPVRQRAKGIHPPLVRLLQARGHGHPGHLGSAHRGRGRQCEQSRTDRLCGCGRIGPVVGVLRSGCCC